MWNTEADSNLTDIDLYSVKKDAEILQRLARENGRFLSSEEATAKARASRVTMRRDAHRQDRMTYLIFGVVALLFALALAL